MPHLSRSAGGFFTFHLFTYVAFLAMQGFFRTMGLLCSNFDSAFRIATFFVPNMVSYCGYQVPIFEMKRWLFWIVSLSVRFFCVSCLTYCEQSYINPLYYGKRNCIFVRSHRVRLSNGNTQLSRGAWRMNSCALVSVLLP